MLLFKEIFPKKISSGNFKIFYRIEKHKLFLDVSPVSFAAMKFKIKSLAKNVFCKKGY